MRNAGPGEVLEREQRPRDPDKGRRMPSCSLVPPLRSIVTRARRVACRLRAGLREHRRVVLAENCRRAP